MKKPLGLLGSVILTFFSLSAWAQQTPTPPTQTPMVGEIAPVPGTDEAITSMNAAIADQVFVANLSGFAEIPPRQTDASGAVVVSLNPDGNSLHYRLFVSNLQDVTAAHLHLGLQDENGPIVVPLLGQGAPGDAATPPSGVAEGIIAEGDVSADNLTGPLASTPLVVLMELLRSGAIYANVHTTQYPAGEIRGQMQGVGPSVDGFVELLQESEGDTEDGGTAGNGATGGGTNDAGTSDNAASGGGATAGMAGATNNNTSTSYSG